MTIKQQGGIFGRNPTFNNVAVDGTLTVDQIVEKTGAAGITLDGVTLKDGNVVLANGKGIDFSATSGTGTSELFDDYEEGTWTPSLRFGTSPVYTSQEGVYTKVGRLVLCRFKINLSSHDNTDGSSITINLPFAPAVNDAALVTIDAAASTLLLNSLVENRAGSGGATINANDVVFSAQDGTRLTYTDCNTSGIISGAVQYYV